MTTKSFRTTQPQLNPSNLYYYWYCDDCDVYVGSRPKTDYFNCPYCGIEIMVKKEHKKSKKSWIDFIL